MNPKGVMLHSQVGELFERPREMHIEWRICRLTSLPQETGILFVSSAFYFSNASWHLAIDPNGKCTDQADGCIAVYLTRLDCGPPKAVRFSLGLKKSDCTETKEKGAKTFSRESPSFAVKNFLKLSDLQNRKSELAPLDKFTVVCTLENDAYQHTASTLFTRLWNWSVRLSNILKTPKRTDVMLKLDDGEVVPAHKIILESRSSVFNRMFNTGMGETQTAKVNIEDGNKETLKVVLAYIYSGEPEGLCAQNVREVYKLARTYDLKDLVTLCMEFMQKCSTVDAVVDVMELALSCQDTKLKEWAKDCFLKRKSEMFKSAKWLKIERENSALGFEVVKYVFGG